MFLTDVTNRGSTPGLIHTLTFNEARLQMISENVANSMTPGYRARQLDVGGFQETLRQAFEDRRHPSESFDLRNTDEVQLDRWGNLNVEPTELPVDNGLFHDGTNVSVEREMSDLAETAMMHELTSELLLSNFNGLRKAIRGTL